MPKPRIRLLTTTGDPRFGLAVRQAVRQAIQGQKGKSQVSEGQDGILLKDMPVGETDHPALLEDDPPSKIDGKPNIRRAETAELDALRSELFSEGSTFAPALREDIVGIDNVLVEIDDVIHWLRHAPEYQKMNARLEPGIIFEGDPGTGKTLTSRYIATKSNAFFVNVREFPIAGTLFKASDISDLFKRARDKYASLGGVPIILFWDEFEQGAIERGQATVDQVATVSQLTAELDGVHGKNEGLLLIGCTNYIYGIDEALKRSGRMGLHIDFTAPDREGKKLLLDHYLGKFEVGNDVDLDTLSYFFDSTDTAADIEEACIEAWRNAVHRSIDADVEARMAQKDLVKVFIKRLVGPPTTFVNLPTEDSERIAVHEVGHAIMALVYDIPLRLLTIQPGKKTLGRVITAEVREHIGTMDEWVSQMRVTIGSIVAEECAGIPALVGSTNDLEKVNQIATRLVDSLYKGERTGIYNPKAVAQARGGRQHPTFPGISEGVVANSDADVKDLLATTYRDAKNVMHDIGKDRLWEIARAVNQKTTLTGDEFRVVVIDILGPLEAFKP